MRNARRRLAFVCPGQGGQWGGMALALAASEPVFAAALERLDRALRASTEWSLIEQLERAGGPEAHPLEDIDVVQPILAALSLAYADLFRAYGVEADAVVGRAQHGRRARGRGAGAIGAEDALRIVALRSRLMRKERGKGAMALVDAPAAEVEARLNVETVSIAAVNSPRACVISGDVADVTALVDTFQRDGIFARLVKVDVASHSPQMTAAAGALQRSLAGLVPGQRIVQVRFSAVWTECGRRGARPVVLGAQFARTRAFRRRDAVPHRGWRQRVRRAGSAPRARAIDRTDCARLRPQRHG